MGLHARAGSGACGGGAAVEDRAAVEGLGGAVVAALHAAEGQQVRGGDGERVLEHAPRHALGARRRREGALVGVVALRVGRRRPHRGHLRARRRSSRRNGAAAREAALPPHSPSPPRRRGGVGCNAWQPRCVSGAHEPARAHETPSRARPLMSPVTVPLPVPAHRALCPSPSLGLSVYRQQTWPRTAMATAGKSMSTASPRLDSDGSADARPVMKSADASDREKNAAMIIYLSGRRRIGPPGQQLAPAPPRAGPRQTPVELSYSAQERAFLAATRSWQSLVFRL